MIGICSNSKVNHDAGAAANLFCKGAVYGMIGAGIGGTVGGASAHLLSETAIVNIGKSLVVGFTSLVSMGIGGSVIEKLTGNKSAVTLGAWTAAFVGGGITTNLLFSR